MSDAPSDPGAPGDAARVVPDPAAPPDDGERRLHPWSWMFVLLTQLRPWVLPLLAFLVLGRGASWELYGAFGAVVLALYSLVYSIGFRYRIGDGELVVREGIVFRSERHIPFARAQNIVQKRNPLHRWFEVTELRLESAGGSRPEAVMNVISRAEAERLVGILRGQGETDDGVAGGAAAEPALALDHRELVRLGLFSNRGWILVGTLMAVLAQGNYWDAPAPWEGKAIRSNLKALGSAYDSVWHALSGPLSWILLVLVGLVLIKVLSIVMTFVTFHGFRLTLGGERIATESGLLVRQLANARREKIQRLLIGEGWLARRFGRQWLQCEIATGAQSYDGQEAAARLRWIAPIATPGQVQRLVAELMPGCVLEQLQWRPLHPRAWSRLAAQTTLMTLLPTLGLVLAFGPTLALAWPVLVLFAVLYARRWTRYAAYAFDGRFVAFRAGWLHRQWTVTRVDLCQSVALTESPFDRRHGMASVAIDTAGAGTTAFRLTVPFLPEAEARILADALGRELATAIANADGPGLERAAAV